MTRSHSSRFAAAAVLAAAGLGAATAAQAHTDVFFSIGMPGRAVYVEPPPVYVQPPPVYVQSQPVYVQPQPVYVRPQPVYVQPPPIYVQPPAYRYERPWQESYQDEFEREHGWQRTEWQRRQWERRHHHKRDGHGSYDRDRD